MKELQRINVGKFNIEKAITFKELEENKENVEFLENN